MIAFIISFGRIYVVSLYIKKKTFVSFNYNSTRQLFQQNKNQSLLIIGIYEEVEKCNWEEHELRINFITSPKMGTDVS